MVIWEMHVSASCMIVFTCILRCFALHRLPKQTFLSLWCLAAIRLLLPIRIRTNLNAFSALQMQLPHAISTGNMPGMQALPPQLTAPDIASSSPGGMPSATAFSRLTLLLYIWGIVALLLCIYFIAAHLRWRQVYKASSPLPFPVPAISQYTKRPVMLACSSAIASPLTFGVFKATILFPTSFPFANATQLHSVLLHECTHIKKLDVLKKWVLALLLCVHWFNPFVWLLFVMANRDIELVCDAHVLATLGYNERRAYASALVLWKNAGYPCTLPVLILANHLWKKGLYRL